jgi:Flp pilus assembly pilin Flp
MGFETTIDRLRATARALRRDHGASVSMEYGLVGTLISVAIIASLSSTTTGLGDKWNSVANSINAFLR